jgi:hypothetical protein
MLLKTKDHLNYLNFDRRILLKGIISVSKYTNWNYLAEDSDT